MDRVKDDAAARAVRIFLLVGNRLLRDALLRLFRKPPDVSIVGQGSPSVILPSDVQESDCDLILRYSIPVPASADDTTPQVPQAAEILLVGMEDDEEEFLSAVRAGA